MNGQQGSTSGDGADLTADGRADDRIGSLIADRYRIEALIGRGGMASVYAAADTTLPRRVALKIFRPELADRDDIRRHDGEVGMLAGLNHPGLVTLYDAVSDADGAAVLVLELVDGTDLRTALDARELSSRDIALIGATIADALAYSHERGIVHRDVKPANILVPVSGDGHTGSRAKLADFGIARLVDETRMTAIGSVIGTAHYLSPEQALGVDVGAPSDVYSLGLVLIEALSGARTFPGTGIESVAARLARDPELPAGMHPDWAALLREMTVREPEDRLRAASAGPRLRVLADVQTGLDAPPRAELDADALDRTLLLPSSGTSSATAITELMADRPVGADDLATVALANPGSSGRADRGSDVDTVDRAEAAAPPRTRRTAMIVSLVLGAILVAGGGITLGARFASTSSTADPAGTPDYPAVDGMIGDHLEQLQQSVAP